MEILLWIYFVGLGVCLGVGVCLLFLGGILGIEPKDSTILKFVGFALGWPVTYPVWAAWVTYKDR
ncbi:hypothetical protein PP460_gp113 [Streptomyces phage Muntaha]|uniref:Uncharacterized protein n=1 Tax=Streptomyces phage Muntaha TaxID=2713269 RepID=A0A6G8R3B2_9CAUD|nr:hypothetical protein PP460_gp113 [Streptomyces phage Muntaha]QIN94689.1 hypothetical protein SEA_MUNTAHA_164 [Streptomyces phage Muntaha]